MEYVFGGFVLGVVVLIMGACAIAPMLFDSMSKEDKEAEGIIWKSEDRQ